MNYFFSIVISCEKRNTIAWGFADPMHLFIKYSIFHNFWAKLRPRFWDIFSISGNALMNHFFSIVLSCEKSRKSVMWGYADPMHLFIKYSIFHNYMPNSAPRFWDIFSISGNALMNHFFSIVISCEKCEKRLCEVLRIRCTFSSKHSIFYHFWPKFRPTCWDIFSISGNTLMNNFFSIVISCEKGKNDCVRFCGSDAPFHQLFNFS